MAHDDRPQPVSTPAGTPALTWDADVDAGYLALADVAAGAAVHQRTVPNPVAGRGELLLDFDADGRLLGVEFLDRSTLPPA